MYGLEGVVRLSMYLCIIEEMCSRRLGVRTPFVDCWAVLCMYCFGSPTCLGALALFVDCMFTLFRCTRSVCGLLGGVVAV